MQTSPKSPGYVQLTGSNLQYETLITQKTDYTGKISGRSWDYPHTCSYVAASASLTSLPTPNASNWIEFSQSDYGNIQVQDGTVKAFGTNFNGTYRFVKMSYDMLTTARRTLGLGSNIGIYELRSLLKSIAVTWVGWGKGYISGALNNGATIKAWNKRTNAWDTIGSNTASTPTAIVATLTNFADYIDDNGLLHISAQDTTPSDGTNSAYLNMDYAKLDFTIAGTMMNQGGSDAKGSATVSVGGTAIDLGTIPPGATKAFITCETTQVRYWVSGATPTTTAGHLANSGDTIMLDSPGQIRNFLAIAVTGTASLQVSFF